MKLNLLMCSDDVLAGYRNIDPVPTFTNTEQAFSSDKEIGDVQCLDGIADDGEVEEIIAQDIIDYVDIPNKLQTIQNWVKKLSYNAKLVISGIDLYETCKSFGSTALSDEQAILLLYGDPDFPFGQRRGCLQMEQVINILTQLGLVVIQKRISNFRYTIVAERRANAS